MNFFQTLTTDLGQLVPKIKLILLDRDMGALIQERQQELDEFQDTDAGF